MGFKENNKGILVNIILQILIIIVIIIKIMKDKKVQNLKILEIFNILAHKNKIKLNNNNKIKNKDSVQVCKILSLYTECVV